MKKRKILKLKDIPFYKSKVYTTLFFAMLLSFILSFFGLSTVSLTAGLGMGYYASAIQHPRPKWAGTSPEVMFFICLITLIFNQLNTLL